MHMKLSLDQAALNRLATDFGIHFMGKPGEGPLQLQAMDRSIAFDAQPQLVTTANAGILSLFTTYVDPKIIEILVSPMKAAMLYGEKKLGDWTEDTAAFPVAERTGTTTAYGDYQEGGLSGANVNWPQRQSFHYQTFTRWGQRELERNAKAKIDWANQVNEGSVLALNKFQNYSYLFGITGLQNYGGINDPSLPASIAVTSSWFTATPDVIYGDIVRLVQQAIAQGNGLIDTATPFKMGISPGNESNFSKTNTYNVNVHDQIKKNFNIEIVTIPEFSTAGSGGTELVQLIAESVEGQKTVDSAFTEKMRAHAMITLDSSWRQKKSQGTWGTVFYAPVFVASMHA
jgi:hypothetical protein